MSKSEELAEMMKTQAAILERLGKASDLPPGPMPTPPPRTIDLPDPDPSPPDAKGRWVNYEAFLRSNAWRRIRSQVLKRARGRCEACHSYCSGPEVHHVVYTRWGQERLRDLVALCAGCHKRIHWLLDKGFDRRESLARLLYLPFKTRNEDDSSLPGDLVLCPICGHEYQSSGVPHVIPGYDRGMVGDGFRGSCQVIPFRGECGSLWELRLSFHKGQTNLYVKIIETCQQETHRPAPWWVPHLAQR